MIRAGIAVAAAVLAVGPAAAGENLSRTRAKLAAGDEVTIVCLGDSVTGRYYHTGGVRAWSDLLAEGLQGAFPDARVQVKNEGVSGSTLRRGLERFETRVAAQAPDLVIAMFGLNDVPRISAREFRAQWGELLDRIFALGSDVILLTPNAVTAGDPARPPGSVGEFAEEVRTVARERGVPMVDCHQLFAQCLGAEDDQARLLMSDAIHPSLYGHRLIASAVLTVVTGKAREMPEIEPRGPTLARLRDLMAAGGTCRILAVPPYGKLVAEALQRLRPDVGVQVTEWSTTVGEEASPVGKWIGPRRRRGDGVQSPPPDLVVVGMPPEMSAATERERHDRCSELINAAMSFGAPEWDVIVVLPSVLENERNGSDEQISAISAGRDLAAWGRRPGNRDTAAELIARFLRERLRREPEDFMQTRKGGSNADEWNPRGGRS